MSELLVDDLTIEVKLSHRRRSVSIQVRNGGVRVLAPVYLAKHDLLDFVVSKKQWIYEKLEQQSCHSVLNTIKHLLDAEEILYLGRNSKVSYEVNNSSDVLYVDNQFFVYVKNSHSLKSPAYLLQAFQQFFAQKANIHFPQRLQYWSKYCNLQPSKLVIKRYKARWGSCNSRGEISLNFLLMMTPEWVIDYVIVHELCHLTHLNHSKDFWQLVERFYPDYKSAKKWLHQHGYLLEWSL